LRRPVRRRGPHVVGGDLRIDSDIVGRKIGERHRGRDAGDAALQSHHERLVLVLDQQHDGPGMARPRHTGRTTLDPPVATVLRQRKRAALRDDDGCRSFGDIEACFAQEPVGDHGLRQRHGRGMIAGNAQQRDRLRRCNTETAGSLAHQSQWKARVLHLCPHGIRPLALLDRANILLVERPKQTGGAFR